MIGESIQSLLPIQTAGKGRNVSSALRWRTLCRFRGRCGEVVRLVEGIISAVLAKDDPNDWRKIVPTQFVIQYIKAGKSGPCGIALQTFELVVFV